MIDKIKRKMPNGKKNSAIWSCLVKSQKINPAFMLYLGKNSLTLQVKIQWVTNGQ